MSKKDKILSFNLKREWFDKINSGEKTHEYRVVKTHWERVLDIHMNATEPFYQQVRFICGMRPDSPKMLFKLKNVSIVDGKNTDLKFDGLVYDIELGERINENS